MSPTEQRERIAAECKHRKFRLVEVFEELDVSGGDPLQRRPGLSRALDLVEGGKAQVLVVAYFDRLFRSLAVQHEVTERFEKAGGTILALDFGELRTDTAAHWISSTLLGAVTEYQRRSTSERTEDSKRRSVENGVPPFPNLPPWLERRAGEKNVRFNAKKARVVRAAAEMRLDGVIDLDTWQRLQRTTVRRGRRPKSDRLLARLDILHCGTCNARMVVGTSQSKYPFYRCPPIGDCPQRVTIGAEIAERVVVDAVKELLAGIKGRASVEVDAAAAADELARKQRALETAIRAFDGVGDEHATRERLRELREERDAAREHHDDLLNASAPAITLTVGDWEDLAPAEQRALIRAVVDRAIVSPGRGDDRILVKPRSK